jgi:hypothetical protein
VDENSKEHFSKERFSKERPRQKPYFSTEAWQFQEVFHLFIHLFGNSASHFVNNHFVENLKQRVANLFHKRANIMTRKIQLARILITIILAG